VSKLNVSRQVAYFITFSFQIHNTSGTTVYFVLQKGLVWTMVCLP
jgi:hypothetical protein